MATQLFQLLSESVYSENGLFFALFVERVDLEDI
jgi:hypothetical protein